MSQHFDKHPTTSKALSFDGARSEEKTGLCNLIAQRTTDHDRKIVRTALRTEVLKRGMQCKPGSMFYDPLIPEFNK
jgi:hypothetical protein